MTDIVDIITSMSVYRDRTWQLTNLKPKFQKPFNLGRSFLILGPLINYLLTDYAFRTVIYQDLGPIRTDLTSSVRTPGPWS